ncbi:MAG: hypothetical protein KatS3mg082_0465 [Nitrospiraceae bacterium]|nr:MAG: hypothetical protein KatS3mg082_0465 [Nitrospiraceae bacterium]
MKFCLTSPPVRHARRRCSINDCDRYWTSTYIARMPEFRKLLRTKSMMRYFPAKGTAGLLRTAVNGMRRSPLPPAMIMARTLG